MSASAILESVVTGKSGDLITLFQQTMYQKIFEALNVRRQELAKTIFKEDKEPLDEISRQVAGPAEVAINQKQRDMIKKYSPNNPYVNKNEIYQKFSPEDKAEWDKHQSSLKLTNQVMRDPTKATNNVPQTDAQKIQAGYDKKMNSWNKYPY